MHSSPPRPESTRGQASLYSILLPRRCHCGRIPQALWWRVLNPRTGEAQAADLGYGVACTGRETRGRDEVTTTFRTHFTFRIDTWTPDGESIVEHVAGIYRAACQRWPGIPITLRQGARVIEDSRRLRVVSSQ